MLYASGVLRSFGHQDVHEGSGRGCVGDAIPHAEEQVCKTLGCIEGRSVHMEVCGARHAMHRRVRVETEDRTSEERTERRAHKEPSKCARPNCPQSETLRGRSDGAAKNWHLLHGHPPWIEGVLESEPIRF